jgi:uncharacterized cupin superfamily protein
MPDTLVLLGPIGADPEESRPDPARVLSGDPVFTTWNHEDSDGLLCGLWRATPGRWRISYDEWEYCRIISGLSVITQDDGPPLTLRPGASLILRPGFTGTWEVMETTVKDYVIRLPTPPGT